jgi:acetyl-CoA acetyltransferase
MAGLTHRDFDLASIYDCFTVTVPLTLENAGFCKKGQGTHFLRERSMRFDGGGFPVNPHGGQLGSGPAGYAGGAAPINDTVFQLQNRATGHQVPNARKAFVNGTGGLMSEQIALVLEAA